LQKLYNNKYNIVICGDINYLMDSNRRSQLDAVLHSYNLTGVVGFHYWHIHHWKIWIIPPYKWTFRSWCPIVNIK